MTAMSAAPDSTFLREALVECARCPARAVVSRADEAAPRLTCGSCGYVRESDAGTSRLTWWIVRQDGREPIFGLALRLTTSAAAAKCCGRSASFTLIIWNGSSPARSATGTSRRLVVRAGIGADPLRDLHQRVRGPEPDRVEERILDEELAAAVVGIAAVAARAREVREAVVGRVVGALGRVDVAAVAPLLGLHAARGSTTASGASHARGARGLCDPRRRAGSEPACRDRAGRHRDRGPHRHAPAG
jgi:ribosomal protein S27AE